MKYHKRLSNAHSSPILPPILPNERPNYYGGRPDPPTSTMSIPRRQLWTLPSRTPSYDSLNNDIHEHESAKHPEIEKVNQLLSFCMRGGLTTDWQLILNRFGWVMYKFRLLVSVTYCAKIWIGTKH
jgi:hypothetical protein